MRRVIVLMAVVLTACGGPKEPFELGLKEVPSDLLLGRQTKSQPLPAQLPPQTFFTDALAGPSAGSSTTLPPPVQERPRPLPACAEGDPRIPARLPAALDVPRPPVPASYEYRTTGHVRAPVFRTLAPVTTHEVANVRAGLLGETYFDVRVFEGESTTSTTYHIVPRTSMVVPPGLYISRVDSGGGLAAFEPKPELLVLPFPALPGTTFTGAGSDGLTSISYDGLVEGKERIDACGTPLDGIKVTLSNGRATTGRTGDEAYVAEEFRAVYVFATQYGGLSIADFVEAKALGGLSNADRMLITMISSEPRS
jgi:hypothetical protein